MARTQVAVAVLAIALIGCAYEPAADRYEPAPDRLSDPLSSADREELGVTLEVLDGLCETGVDVDVAGVDETVLLDEEIKTLTRLARKRPHGVYRPGRENEGADQGSFSGDTMIQVLERAAHQFDDCLPDASEEMRRSAELLRSPR